MFERSLAAPILSFLWKHKIAVVILAFILIVGMLLIEAGEFRIMALVYAAMTLLMIALILVPGLLLLMALEYISKHIVSLLRYGQANVISDEEWFRRNDRETDEIETLMDSMFLP